MAQNYFQFKFNSNSIQFISNEINSKCTLSLSTFVKIDK